MAVIHETQRFSYDDFISSNYLDYLTDNYGYRNIFVLRLTITDINSDPKLYNFLNLFRNKAYYARNWVQFYLDLSDTYITNCNNLYFYDLESYVSGDYSGVYFVKLPHYDENVKQLYIERIEGRGSLDYSTVILNEGLEYLSFEDSSLLGNFFSKNELPSTLKTLNLKGTNITQAPTLPNGLLRVYFGYTNITQAPILPETITSLEETFYHCSYLKYVPNIPKNITSMASCFSSCSSLEEIQDFEPSSVSGITMTNCFEGCTKLNRIRKNVSPTKTEEYKTWKIQPNSNDTVNVTLYDQNGDVERHINNVPYESPYLFFNDKIDELFLAPVGGTTDEIIKKSIQARKPVSSFQKLDPDNKSLVLWAENPSTLMTNMVFPNGLTTTCDSGASATTKEIVLSNWQGDSLPDNCEINVTFTNANTYGDTTASTPTNPKLLVKNANGDTIHTLDICDSRGHVAGTGCWNAGDLIVFKKVSSKAIITNSDVRQSTNDYKIYSDNLIEYVENFNLTHQWTNKIWYNNKRILRTCKKFEHDTLVVYDNKWVTVATLHNNAEYIIDVKLAINTQNHPNVSSSYGIIDYNRCSLNNPTVRIQVIGNAINFAYAGSITNHTYTFPYECVLIVEYTQR